MQKLMLALLGLAASTAALAESPLADAIERGNRAAALALIADGADVNAAQADGTTPLHWATFQLDAELVRELVQHGAKPDAPNRFGASPLSEAVKAANAPLVTLLLDAGADPDAPNADGETALMLAARTGSAEVAAKLIAAGANVNAREQYRAQTALMWAAEGAFAPVVKLLIENGADVRARAATNDWGAQITSEPRAQYRPTGGLTPLLYAARSGCAECVRAIVAAGEDIDRPTPDGVTALMVALDNFEFDTAKALLDLGANPHVADWWGRTALYLAVDLSSYVPRSPAYPRSSATQGIDLVHQLLAAGVDVNPQLNFHRPGRGGNSARFVDDLLTTGATPLLRAAITHDHDVMRLLIEHGARVDLPNVMGVTPLMAAASIGVREPGFGANRAPDYANDKNLEQKIVTSIEILLGAGADINAAIADLSSRTARIARLNSMTDRLGQTALHSAAGRGWPVVVAYLLEHGANPAAKDALGKTPLDLAITPVGGRAVANGDVIAEMLRSALAGPSARQAAR